MRYFPYLLTSLFVGLKLTGHIDWSWWLVFLPVIISVTLALSIVAGALLILWKKL